MRHRLVGLVSLCLLGAAVGCKAKDSSMSSDTRSVSGLSAQCKVDLPGYYYLGYLGHVSGDATDAQPTLHLNVLLAASQVNAGGGVHGKKLGVILCDNKSTTEGTTAAMNEMMGLSPKPSVATGPNWSSWSLAAIPIAAANKVTLVSDDATSAALAAAPSNGYFFSVSPSDNLQGAILAKIAQSKSFGKVFVAYTQDDAYTTGLYDVFNADFAALGGTVASAAFDPSSVSYVTDTLASIQSSGAQAVLLVVNDIGQTEALMAQAASQGLDVQWLLSDTSHFPELATHVPYSYLQRVTGTIPSAWDGASYDTFVSAFTAVYGAVSGEEHSPTLYDASWLAATAMELADNPEDGTEVRDALHKTGTGQTVEPGEWAKVIDDAGSDQQMNYDGASGTVDFDAHNQVTGNIGVWTVAADGTVPVTGCYTPDFTPCS